MNECLWKCKQPCIHLHPIAWYQWNDNLMRALVADVRGYFQRRNNVWSLQNANAN